MFGQQNTPFGSPQGTGGFGATNTAPAFGSPAPAPFGAPAPAFGGGGTGFGSPAPAPGGFGATGGFGAPSNTGFGGNTGGFGAPAAPAQTGFGATGGAFGSTANTSPFGAPAPAPSGGLFGSSAPAPSGGLFGSNNNTSTGFGATNTSTAFGGGGGGAFGGGGSTGAFGTQQTSAFGTPAPAVPSTGLFGAPTPAPAFGSTGFGATNNAFSPAPAPTGGIFGAAPSPGTGLFGSAPAAPGQPQQPGQGGGSKVHPFQVTNRQDGTSNISMQSITAMPQYENKSFEELRYEDYMQGNRGSSANPTPGSNFSFGAAAPAPTGGLFGSATPAPAPFGAPAPAPFGAPAPAPFGSPAPAPFGAPAAPAPFSFGSPAPAPFGAPAPAAPFGQAPAPSAFGSTFGAKPATGLFGSPAPAPGGGLFGSSPTPAPAPFGAPAPATGGLFGSAPAPATGGLFGNPAPATGGLFGSTPAPAPAFGAPAPAGGLFGSAPAAPAGGLFGTPAPAPAFGAPAAGGLFGAPAPPPAGGLFAPKPPGQSLFGAPAPAATGGLFGAAPAAPSTGLFGAQPQAPVAPAAYPPAGSIIPPAANEVLAHQLTALENKRKEIEKLDVWRGNSPESSALVPVSQPESDSHIVGLISGPSQQSLSPYRPLTKSTAKIRPRGFAPLASPPASTPLTAIGSGARPMMSPDTFVASSVKRLVIKPGSLTPKPKMRLRLTDSPGSGEKPLLLKDASPAPLPKETITSPPPQEMDMASPEATTQTAAADNRASSVSGNEESRLAPAAANLLSPRQESPAQQRTVDNSPKESPSNEPGLDYYRKIVGSPDSGSGGQCLPSGRESASFVPKLTKPGYEVSPSIAEMSSYSEADLAAVEGFAVKRMPHGMVQWEGLVDVRGADLDRIIEIGQSDVAVYLREEEENTKPAQGTKLNRPAILTYYNIFPKGGADADSEAKSKFARKIEKSTKRLGAKLISYDQDSGEWKIRVEHFSRYCLDDDTSEDESTTEVTMKGSATTPGGSLVVGRLQDEEMDQDLAIVSDVETNDPKESNLRKAEAAYEMMFGLVNEAADDQPVAEPMAEDGRDDVEVAFFKEADWQEDGPFIGRPSISDDDYLRASAGFSISSKIAKNCGVRSSNIDFGMRMGKSFRVGWSRDGSFVRLGPAGKSSSPSLTRCRPLFAKGETGESQPSHLATHKAHAIRQTSAVSDCPRYVLPRGVGKTGDQSLYNTISSYSRAKEASNNKATSEEDLVSDRAFSLLSCLQASSETSNPGTGGPAMVLYDGKASTNGDRRKREAISRWLVNSCERDVDREIEVAKQRDDTHSAVFAALSGGDLEKASDIAMSMGDVHLAVLLASGVEGQRDITEQLRVWQESGSTTDLPHQLMRIYRLIGGDMKGEGKLCKTGESLLDWRRHLTMRVTTGSMEQGIAEILRNYNTDVAAGVAPYPHPRYVSLGGSNAVVQCVLYRLLRLLEEPQQVPLLEIVDPLGHGKFAHDYSFSFHLAAVLTAMGICPSLSEYDEFRLAESYIAQLVSQGKWDWAVYVSLCSSGNESRESSQRKLSRSKDLVLQNFSPDDRRAGQQRKFLEQIGVPSEWIEEALALRYMHMHGGDPFQYIRHLSKFSPTMASRVVDDVIVPNLLFMNVADIEKGLKHLKVYANAIGPLGRALVNLFELATDIRALANAGADDVEEAMPTLLGVCDEIEKVFVKRQSVNKVVHGSPGIGFHPGFRTIPLASMLVEAMEHVAFLRLQLEALRSGMPISDRASNKALPAQLAFLTLAGYDERLSKGSRIVRGLR